ncbi:MAG: galactose-1-phosphate uridylyltransferase [Nitrospirae bacterium]|nr:MAG: galactose-1-phosphate uridylyltransferase [Nitrospirota bacterium]
MSLLRQDPTTKDWVIIAPQRAKRPDQFAQSSPHPSSEALPVHDPSCPFCPGNETLTPPEILRLSDSGTGEWQVRVVPNKFPALQPTGPSAYRTPHTLFYEMDGVGSHEVIIETPRHNERLALMSDQDVAMILRACQRRYRDLLAHPHVNSVVLFKNHGKRAGTSLQHPHMQVVAAPIAPVLMRRKVEVATTYYDETGRCLYSDMVEAELQAGSRIVIKKDGYVVFQPFASRLPFETWIMPHRPVPSFALVSEEDLPKVASVLRRTLAVLDTALQNPDFNLVLHSVPTTGGACAWFSWHIQILPRLTAIAGFELGSGMFINTLLPEESAKILRNAYEALP